MPTPLNKKHSTPSPKGTPTFVDLVQQHERAWGTHLYPNRPSLALLLGSPVVAWWRSAKIDEVRLMASVHTDLDELEKYVARLVIYSKLEMPSRRLAMIYINQKRATIRAVRVDIRTVDDE